MKTTIAIIAALVAFSAAAQTNIAVAMPNALTTNAPVDATKYDLTLGASGTAGYSQQSASAISISLSANPFKGYRQLWLGAAQSLAWKPFSGSTDLDAEWQIAVYKDVGFILPAWSGGAAYGQGKTDWRTGPEIIAQYYTTDNSFIYGQVNYDLNEHGAGGLRWSVGSGLEF